ncbi:MAG: Transcription elongation factor-like protein [Candidatus Woesebacteria bacterium GW2011_GWB1_43_14]|uniref:Transcription termination/antitermination protein NusA n=1 Tax=Candidatus Woesebacteria bacterium GW2011_GWB1_43_14 TaxID=1618578 RepID=A0A0G1DIK5_9BACT|nr:MAG: Transcription elongation factor-like protein [Candidatus Woesebacteria bacterium GW2011_GWA1_39_11b]KKS77994.1 MAG: Transcription elongation factor-like protein [Candidatus Woesebacteria bacterium GW2011_GWC1_42_9]KKS97427.1 MAG: Transcription elongation factor-like protein [Candidatus Woesebacteria bacterium GW2011_GWB1_43_14]
MAGSVKRTEFSQALKAITQERGLDADVILETIKQAYIAAYKRDAKERGEEVEDFEYDVEMDSVSGEAKIIAWPEGTPDKKRDVTPPGFGRIAAQTAKQVIHQKIREAEKGAIMDEFNGRVGTLVSGMILRFDGPNVRVDIGRTEALMPAGERIPNERLNPSQRLTFLLKSIEDTPRGKQIVLSRSDPQFVEKIFAREVPEIMSGSVVIRGIAREAGVRTKLAVHSEQTGVDPVGSCVGQKGVRVQAVTNELGGERVDIIPWADGDEEFIKAALAPVELSSIKLNKKKKTAVVRAPEDQLSLAIGKDGQNVRLSSQLTGWKIEVESDVKAKPKKEKSKAV